MWSDYLVAAASINSTAQTDPFRQASLQNFPSPHTYTHTQGTPVTRIQRYINIYMYVRFHQAQIHRYTCSRHWWRPFSCCPDIYVHITGLNMYICWYGMCVCMHIYQHLCMHACISVSVYSSVHLSMYATLTPFMYLCIYSVASRNMISPFQASKSYFLQKGGMQV